VNAEEVAEFTAALTRAENAFVSLQLSSSVHVAQVASFVDEIGPLVNKPDGDENINHPKYTKGIPPLFSHCSYNICRRCSRGAA
jgi:hypothetical protein